MAATEQADYFSKQVVRMRRFFLPDWRERRSTDELCLVGGGCEWCSADFVIERERFPFLAFEFVARGKGRVTLGGKSHPLARAMRFSSIPRRRM